MRPLVLELDANETSRKDLLDLRDLLRDHPGDTPVDLILIRPGSYEVRIQLPVRVYESRSFVRAIERF